jgi:hypothetical protein
VIIDEIDICEIMLKQRELGRIQRRKGAGFDGKINLCGCPRLWMMDDVAKMRGKWCGYYSDRNYS